MHPVIWRLAGFAIFMLAAWAAFTLFIMLPWPRLSWAAWQLAGMVMIKFTAAVSAGWAFVLGFSWLANPPEQD